MDIKVISPFSTLNSLLSVITKPIGNFDYITIAILVMLDVLFSAPEATFGFLTAATFGAAGLHTSLIWGILDVGLILLGMALVLIIEEGILHKGLKHTIPMTLFAGVVLMFPFPVLTLGALIYKVGADFVAVITGKPILQIGLFKGTVIGITLPVLMMFVFGLVVIATVAVLYVLLTQGQAQAGAFMISSGTFGTLTPMDAMILIILLGIGTVWVVHKKFSKKRY